MRFLTPFYPLYCLIALYFVREVLVWLVVSHITPHKSDKYGRLVPPRPKTRTASEDEPAPGETVTVAQLLRPTGSIRWHDRIFPARSLDIGHQIEPGREVRIRAKDSIYFVVEAVRGPERGAL